MKATGGAAELERTVVEAWLEQHLTAWAASDVLAITEGLQSEAHFILPPIQGVGRSQAQALLTSRLAELQAVYLHVRRLLIDVRQRAAAVEWICRWRKQAEPEYREIMGGTILDFDLAGLVSRWRTYLDPVRQRNLADLAVPLPDEGWSPSSNPGPSPARETVVQLLQAYATAWASHDPAQFRELIHDEMCIHPPWDYMLGRTAVEAGMQTYFANYLDTQVTPHRILIDPSQPYFGVCEQTFACTNPDTGRRGEDHDFAFFEVAQGKLRYWRTYFDTTHSAQTVEKTVGFLHQQSTKS